MRRLRRRFLARSAAQPTDPREAATIEQNEDSINRRSKRAPRRDRVRLAIIIVNYRTPELTVDCIRSLMSERGHASSPAAQVVVVDNASEDASLNLINAAIEAHGWSGAVELVPSPANRGFAAGNNLGIRMVNADQYLLLNPDTVVAPSAVNRLAAFLDEHSEVGVVGAQLLDENGRSQRSAHRFPSPLREFMGSSQLGVLERLLPRVADPVVNSNEPTGCDWVSGAAMLIRRGAIDQIGLLDEDYFLYFEEVDFCRRAREAGWQVWLDPRAEVVHLEGSATGIRRCQSRRGRWWYESRRRFFIKHYGILGWLWADLLWSIGRMSLLIRRLLRLGGSTIDDPTRFTLDLLGGDVRALVTGQALHIKRRLVS